MSDVRIDGWLREAEDEAFLKELRRPRLPKAFKTFARPAEILPEESHQLEDQGPMGSCQGHGIASCTEQLNYIATAGDRTQLSNIFAYLATQWIDGLLGSDRGSTISGGVSLATNKGICPLANAPYPNPVRYPNDSQRRAILSEANYAAGAPFKVRSSVGIRSHEQALEWIGGGGVLSLGISWPPRIETINGRKTATAATRGGGGHAIAGLGYRRNGNLIFANSHNYWLDITPSAFEAMLRHQWTVCIGLSDMANPKPRDLSWLKESRRNRLAIKPELWQ